MASARYAWLLGLVIGVGCVDKGPPVVVRNECLSSADCEEGARCQETLKMCERLDASVPYEVVLRVRQSETKPDLKLASETIGEPFLLTGFTEDKKLELVRTRVVLGRVSMGAENVEAQITLTPQTPLGEGRSIVVDTKSIDAQHNFAARVALTTEYQVTVQPVGKLSEMLPPLRITLKSTQAELPAAYPELQKVSTKIVGATNELANKRARLQNLAGETISSTSRILENGELTLYALPEQLERPYQLVINLVDEPLWRVTMALDGARLGPEVPVPSVPGAILYSAGIGSPNDAGVVPLGGATFISHFGSDSDASTADSGVVDEQLDWCRPRGPRPAPIVRCQAQVSTLADEQGRFSVLLVPGKYAMYLTPGRAEGTASRLAATVFPEIILIPAGDVDGSVPDDGGVLGEGGVPNQRGRVHALDPAYPFRGRVLSPSHETPMANVTLAARSLNHAGVIGDVARYTQSKSALTRGNGLFDMQLERGYFDLYVEPPAGSGYAWAGRINSEIAPDAGTPRDPVFLDPIIPDSPVYVTGHVYTVERLDGGAPTQKRIEGAEVEAFVMVEALLGTTPQRPVSIGRATTNEFGEYRLPLPPAVDGSVPLTDNEPSAR